MTTDTKGMVTIFEGPDGVGKTTLAKAYAKAKGHAYYHFGPYMGEDNIAHHYARVLRRAYEYGENVVLDRSWISERIYGPALRSYDRIGKYRQRSLERLAAACNTLVVMPVVPFETILASFGEKPELPKKEQLHAIYRSYFNRGPAALTNLPVLELNRANIDVMLEMIDHVSHERTIPHPLPWQTAGWLGMGTSCLLVGDRAAEPKKGYDLPDFQWPFGSFSCQGCSIWLSDQLAAYDVPERRLFWANADDPHIHSIVSEPWRDRVALGNTAELIVGLSSDSFVKCPHPQYWKRFHSDELYPLPVFLRGIFS